MTKRIVIVSGVCIIFPFSIFMSHWRLIDILLGLLPILTGNILLITQIKNYTKLQRKLLYIVSSLSILNFLMEVLWYYQSNYISYVTLVDYLPSLMFWFSYFSYKVITLVLCILLTKKQF
ncbi:hypothetical protein acsn021_10990 [Anaerocolumna cellulosilytica]|uniref:Uncharacterized protein n=1 Tax=Anaerocolumna cellulosilytica TaxID=433286 RepID=A0A6S6R2I9_9FIRM|nr:hypothetical protein [Anaerocolumna cellulosilytica]BCJ93530.1 hypothetical protein acsn021_10990 [Anaerocolumna cellulosilytica]